MIQLNNIWKDRSLPLQLKSKIFKCLVWPVMTYGCESWTLKKDDERKIEAAEMWCHRRLLRVSWKEKRTNKSILEQLKTGRQLLNITNQRKLKYVGHVIRNNRTDLMRSALQGRVEGRRRVGRPSVTMIDNLTRASGMSLHSMSRASLNREEWRRICWKTSFCAAANSVHGDADR